MSNQENGNGMEAQPEVSTDTTVAPTPKPKRKRVKKVLKKVKAKAAKAKKTTTRTVNPETVDEFGLRKGSIKSKAAAMYASAKGATLAEVKAKLGSVQYNVLKQLEERGYKLTAEEEVNKKTGRTASRFRLKAKK